MTEKETFVVATSAVSPSLSSLTHAKSVPSGMEPSINVTSVGTDTMSNKQCPLGVCSPAKQINS